PRRALLVHVELLHLAPVAEFDRPRALRADVQHVAGVGKRGGRTPRATGEVGDLDVAERNRVAAESGGRDVRDRVADHLRVAPASFSNSALVFTRPRPRTRPCSFTSTHLVDPEPRSTPAISMARSSLPRVR